MSNRDRKARTSPVYSKSPIARPALAAVPSRSRSDPSHMQATSTSQSASSTSEPFPPILVVPSPPPHESLAPPHLRTSSVFTSRSASSSISHTASSSIAIHSQNEIDKDAIIARLSTSNAQLEADFVGELSHLSTKFAETAEELEELRNYHKDLQDSWDGLSIDFAAIRDENVRLRNELEHKEDQERESKTRISSLITEREALRGRYEAARASTQDKSEEVNLLRSQVQGLKRWVSSSGRSEGQVTDSAIRTSVSDLSAGLQNWVLKNFRRSKLKPAEEIREEVREKLDEMCPTWETMVEGGTMKVHLIQSLVSRFLVLRIFGSYFVGLPEEQEIQLRNFQQWLNQTSHDASDVNQWRAATLGALNKGTLIAIFASRAEEVLQELTRDIMDLLGAITVSEPTSHTTISQLHILINEAITLSRTLKVQKALFTLHMAVIERHQINAFDAESMEDIGGEDEMTLEGREVLCLTFPGVVKEGDEMGERMELRNCIAKAKVLCVGE